MVLTSSVVLGVITTARGMMSSSLNGVFLEEVGRHEAATPVDLGQVEAVLVHLAEDVHVLASFEGEFDLEGDGKEIKCSLDLNGSSTLSAMKIGYMKCRLQGMI